MANHTLNEFDEALKVRMKMGRDIVKGKKATIEELNFSNPSVVRDCYLFASNQNDKISATPVVSPQIVDLFLAQDSYEDQKKSLVALGRSAERNQQIRAVPFSGLVYLNWNIISSEPELNLDGIFSRLDGSLIHQSRTLYGCPSTNFPKSLVLIKKHVKLFLEQSVEYDDAGCLVGSLVKHCLNVNDVGSVAEVRQLVNRLKRRFWFVLGGEIFSALQLLLSPKETITLSAYQRLDCIFKAFLCLPIYRRILTIRALSGDSFAQEALEENIRMSAEEGTFPKGPYVKILASDWDLRVVFEQISFEGGGLLDETISNLLEAFDALKRRQLRSFTSVLARIQLDDEEALSFINWTHAHRVLSAGATSSTTIDLAVASYFLNYCNFETHPIAHTNRGQGSFIAKLGRALNDSRFVEAVPKIDDFCRRITKLPKVQSNMLAKTLLRREILRLVPYFGNPKNTEMDGQKSGLEKQISHIRFQLAENLFSQGVLSKEFLSRYTYEELEYLKLLRFYEHDQKGRVRVSWATFEKEIHARLKYDETDWYSNFVVRKRASADQSLIEITAEELAFELSADVLFFAPNSLDWCLSNHIRHGHIVGTFLASSYKAIDDFVTDDLGGSGDQIVDDNFATKEELAIFFPGCELHVSKYLDDLVTTVDQFKDYWITLEFGGSTHEAAKQRLQQRLIAFSATTDRSDAAISQLTSDLVNACKDVVEDFLETSRLRLANFLRVETIDHVDRMISKLKDCSVERTEFLRQSLHSGVDSAVNLVDAWLHQNQSSLVAQDFLLSDITTYLMKTVFAAYGRPLAPFLKFSHLEQSGRARSAPKIDGIHFDFFLQVMFNAMQNAFVHSGHGRKSHIQLFVTLAPTELQVRVESELSPEQASVVRRDFVEISSRARSIEPAEFAHEGGSGIAKIKRIARSAFGVDTTVNIPPMSINRNRFIIEYRFPIGADSLVASDAEWRTS